jgi:membrane-associated phospholipid phosphatase
MHRDRLTGRRYAWILPSVLVAVLAAVPLLAPADVRLDAMLDRWRSCAGDGVAALVSDLVEPVGLAVLAVAVLRALWLGRPGRLEVAGILAALGAGVLVIGQLKELLDRPRPAAEFLGPMGASFPSGHVGNTLLNGLAVFALWSGGAPNRPRRRGWLVLAAIVAVVALARVYGRRHWPSDTLGTVALALGYGMVAILHPDARWRRGVTAAAVAVLGLCFVAAESGLRIAIPAGTVAGRREPADRVGFDAAWRSGALRGAWSPDPNDRRHRGVWLRSATGELAIGAVDPGVSELRLVVHPRYDGAGAPACRRLHVALNGRPLGERVLQGGWKSYVFAATAADFLPDDNVLELAVTRAPAGDDAVEERRAAFGELTLHSATAPGVAASRAMRPPPAARPAP